MIWTVFRVGLLRLKNNPMELVLMFVVPIIFFSIFALIFGSGIGSNMSAVKVVFVDEDVTDTSRRIIARLNEEAGLKNVGADSQSRGKAIEMIRNSQAKLAIVVPAEFTNRLGADGDSQIDLLADTSDQIASQIVSAMIRQVVWTEKAALEQARVRAAATRTRPADGSALPMDTRSDTRVDVDSDVAADVVAIEDVLAKQKVNPRVSMYAAGIAVMFLLFSATGHSGSLLDEEENQTLERLMCSRLSMSELLIGKWCWLTILGSLQVTVMFTWAHFVFGVDLFDHIPGFALMTFVTAGAASSFALFLAAACRTRAQLNAVSIILILTMSALGGSMVPRYIMSARMQEIGRYTFNAWALDGFTKVFWRDLQPAALWREVTVLGASALVLLVSARMLARRWETE